MQGLRIQAAGLSDRGLKRSHNEDSLSVVPDLGLFIVADGMGGHSAGEVASRQAIETIVEFLRRCMQEEDFTWPIAANPNLSEHENRIVTSVRLANRDVHRLAEDNSEYHGMGTTIVGALLDPHARTLSVAHVGDSRCYRMRAGRLELLTRDHSWINEQLERGIITAEEARNHRWKNVITRALGHKSDVEVDVHTFELEPNDVYLLCSDGLSGMIDEGQLERLLLSSVDMEECTQELIRAANEAGGQDNISLVILRVLDESGDGSGGAANGASHG